MRKKTLVLLLVLSHLLCFVFGYSIGAMETAQKEAVEPTTESVDIATETEAQTIPGEEATIEQTEVPEETTIPETTEAEETIPVGVPQAPAVTPPATQPPATEPLVTQPPAPEPPSDFDPGEGGLPGMDM